MSVWKRLQRVGKPASKFQFTVSYKELIVECTKKWQPSKLRVVWTRRSRQKFSQLRTWNPTMKNPYVGQVLWDVPENVEIQVTMFRDSQGADYDDKEWTFFVEEHCKGRRKIIACQVINLKEYATPLPSQTTIDLSLKPITKKVVSASLTFTLSCFFIKDGKATDEDMQSMASLMSMGKVFDVGNLNDLEEDLEELPEVDLNITSEISNITMQMQQLDTMLDDKSDIQPTVFHDEWKTTKKKKQKAPPPPNPFGDVEEDVHKNVSNLQRDMSGTNVHLTSVPECNLSLCPVEELPSREDGLSRALSTSRQLSVDVPSSKRLSRAKKTLTLPVVSDKPGRRVDGKNSLQHKLSTQSVERPLYEGTPPSTPEDEKMPVFGRPITPPVMCGSYGNASSFNASSAEKCGITDSCLTASCQMTDSTCESSAECQSPSDELLEWCHGVTQGYRGVCITNLTTSWRSGLAFCAVLHRFRPELIDFDLASHHDVQATNKLAFDTAAGLGIPRVMEPMDMVLSAVPDKLSVMTYLHQLRSFFTGQTLIRSGPSLAESSYGHGGSDVEVGSMVPPAVSKVPTSSASRTTSPEVISPVVDCQQLLPDEVSSTDSWNDSKLVDCDVPSSVVMATSTPVKSGENEGGVQDEFGRTTQFPGTPFASCRTSDVTENRKLIDLFDDDKGGSGHELLAELGDEDNSKAFSAMDSVIYDDCRSEVVSMSADHSDLEQRARLLLDRVRVETKQADGGCGSAGVSRTESAWPEVPCGEEQPAAGKGCWRTAVGMETDHQYDEVHQRRLIERAKALLAEVCASQNIPPLESHHKPSDGIRSSPTEQVNCEEENIGGCDDGVDDLLALYSGHLSEGYLQGSKQYVKSEMVALEREQMNVDRQASELERKLRHVMGKGKHKQLEGQLMRQWFCLVNRKNAMIQRQTQLNIIEKDDNLIWKFDLLNRELRAMMSIADWQKTDLQKRRERHLLEELVAVVNKRDQLVQSLDSQEQAIVEDQMIDQKISSGQISVREERRCTVQ